MEEEIKRLELENDLLSKELLACKEATKKGEDRWMLAFRIVGIVMFVGGIYESLFTMFSLDREVVSMSSFKIYFSIIGFIFFAANKSLGKLANQAGAIMLKWLQKMTGTN